MGYINIKVVDEKELEGSEPKYLVLRKDYCKAKGSRFRPISSGYIIRTGNITARDIFESKELEDIAKEVKNLDLPLVYTFPDDFLYDEKIDKNSSDKIERISGLLAAELTKLERILNKEYNKIMSRQLCLF